MAQAARTDTPPAFVLRSAALTLTAVVLKTPALAALAAAFEAQAEATPGLFEQDPVVLDLSGVRESAEPVDLDGIVALLRRHAMVPVAAKSGSAAQMAAALAAGLGEAPEGQSGVAPRVAAPEDMTSAAAPAAASPPAPALAGARTLVVDKPLRSGQQVYARGGDLVVLSAVSFGAEVIADGHIHVYAPLRGRAIAGARGDAQARIFATCMEPQLVAIAGTYRTTETPLPPEVLARAAQVRLDGERLVVEPLVA